MLVEAEHRDAARVREDAAAPAVRGRTVPTGAALRDGRLVACTALHVPLTQPERAQRGAMLGPAVAVNEAAVNEALGSHRAGGPSTWSRRLRP
ncbi:hypothetical protein SAMN04488546_0500 [Geodermatophilus poikilotrophus]|uniref:Uncharacterized protein n=1 Tax=Geodermatophilus poikilotrophus TaxID=1333667 RepID=A0A1H9ZCY4_9ACTN|nr:hypothetical protein SAMN04488546_0500 [Geodermatophilus poikilotrophus]